MMIECQVRAFPIQNESAPIAWNTGATAIYARDKKHSADKPPARSLRTNRRITTD